MLHRLREVLLTELDVPNTSEAMLQELKARAENVRQLSGDHRLEAFVIRLARFLGGDEDMESLASLATNKPVAHLFAVAEGRRGERYRTDALVLTPQDEPGLAFGEGVHGAVEGV